MTRIDKAVIMARGLGTRMRKQDDSAVLDNGQSVAANTGVKAMIPIGRPFLDYVLSALADAGYTHACLVIGPEHQAVRDYFEVQSPPKRISVEFAIQEKPLGTANAVLAARKFVGDDLFLLMNSDNYYPIEALAALRQLDGAGVALFERNHLVASGNIPEERILKFAVTKIDKEGCLERIYEKPEEEILKSLGASVYVSMNCWKFTPAIFSACLQIKLSARGELELSDAVQYAIDVMKEKLKALIFCDSVLDLSSRSDISAVAEKLQSISPNP
jgi:dTDP-glucose pyrophosphorylase